MYPRYPQYPPHGAPQGAPPRAQGPPPHGAGVPTGYAGYHHHAAAAYPGYTQPQPGGYYAAYGHLQPQLGHPGAAAAPPPVAAAASILGQPPPPPPAYPPPPSSGGGGPVRRAHGQYHGHHQRPGQLYAPYGYRRDEDSGTRGHPASQEHPLGQEQDRSADDGQRSSACLYCPERYRSEPQHLMHRQTRHPLMDFGCGRCSFQSPFADQLARHLALAHALKDARREDMVELCARGLARLPADLRGLLCRLCLSAGRRRYLLGQDRVALRKHVERGHDGLRIGLKALKYECRICLREFPQTEDFLRHPCCQANGQNRILPHPLIPEGDGDVSFGAKRFKADDSVDNPLFKPFASSSSSSAAADASLGEGTSSSLDKLAPEVIEEDEEELEQCLYCEAKVSRRNRASHRASHWDLEFMCGDDCSRSFAFVEDLLEHVKAAHRQSLLKSDGDKENDNNDDEEESSVVVVDPVKLAATKKMTLPADLRLLECNLCPAESRTVLLAQDRYALKKHVRKEHGGTDFDKNMASYKCRLCGRGDFPSSEALLEHQCVRDLMSGAGPASVHGRPRGELLPSGGDGHEDDKLVDLSDIQWEPQSEGGGDLRRLACRLCGKQVNGSRFFAMVRHLEAQHHKFQESRFYSLDQYVLFRCARCLEEFKPEGVHEWAAHFDKNDAGRCTATAAEEGESKGAVEKAMERKRRAEEEEAEKEEEKREKDEVEVNPKDIRTMRCKLCDLAADKTKFLPMQEHLRKCHPTDTVRSLVLDSFVRFGCALCPDFEPESVREWDGHFYKSYETCKATYRDQIQQALLRHQKEGGESSSMRDFSNEDLRRLICHLCQIEIPSEGFGAMGEHLKASHALDVLTAKENFEEKVDFRCAACPAFRPPTVMLWDQHFADSFKTCQGSGKVFSRLKRKVLYWCELCAETRSDLEQHLRGKTHENVVKSLTGKKESSSEEEEEAAVSAAAPVIECGQCPAKVGSKANLHLHRELAGHKADDADKQEDTVKEGDEDDKVEEVQDKPEGVEDKPE